ncbi:MAG: GGDEF domain-containing protein [Pseudomonadota bacterium]
MRVNSQTRVEAPRRSSAAAPSEKAKSVSSATDTVTIAGVPKSELTPRVMDALTKLMDEVTTLREELSGANARIQELTQLAFSDPLTGVHNRRAFVGELDRTLAIVNRHDQAASIAYFDLDDMKSINDGHGHKGGDAAISHVASTLKDNIRATDVVGRLGGDEFGVIFPYADYTAAKEKVKELQSLVSNSPVTVDQDTFSVTVTAGVAPLKQGSTASSALDLADAEMYKGKAAKPSRK